MVWEIWRLKDCYYWQVPRSRAEPWRFIIVFERQMEVQTAVVYLSGSFKVQRFRSAPIRLASTKLFTWARIFRKCGKLGSVKESSDHFNMLEWFLSSRNGKEIKT